MAVSKASATWNGTLKEGSGGVKGTGFEAPFTFASRFEGNAAKGTNPEELIGAAHAGCFTMALTAQLSRAGFTPTRIHTNAAVALYEVFKAKIKGRAKRAHVIAPTFREFFTEYFEDIRAQVREHTADSYEYTIREHIGLPRRLHRPEGS